jgi:hypothetical protein
VKYKQGKYWLIRCPGEESEQKGRIIRAAQALARSRGAVWDQGNRRAADAAQNRAEGFRPVIDEIRAAGIIGLYPIAKELNRRAVATQSGRPWAAWKLQDLLQRLDYYERSMVPSRRQSHVCAQQRAERLRPRFDEAVANGCKTNRDIAGYLNCQGIKTFLGHTWTLDAVLALRQRLLESR